VKYYLHGLFVLVGFMFLGCSDNIQQPHLAADVAQYEEGATYECNNVGFIVITASGTRYNTSERVMLDRYNEPLLCDNKKKETK